MLLTPFCALNFTTNKGRRTLMLFKSLTFKSGEMFGLCAALSIFYLEIFTCAEAVCPCKSPPAAACTGSCQHSHTHAHCRNTFFFLSPALFRSLRHIHAYRHSFKMHHFSSHRIGLSRFSQKLIGLSHVILCIVLLSYSKEKKK